MFRRESEMRIPVISWCESFGFVCAVEFWIVNSHRADIFCGKFGPRPAPRRIPPLAETVAIELKLADVAGAIVQAKSNWHCCDFSYVAMPVERVRLMRTATRRKFIDSGIGLIAVGNPVSVEIFPSARGLGANRRRSKHLWRRVRSRFIELERGAA